MGVRFNPTTTKNSEKSKVAHDEEKSEDLNEQRIELDRESNLTKCKH